jgi:hypothetical protein
MVRVPSPLSVILQSPPRIFVVSTKVASVSVFVQVWTTRTDSAK